MRHPQLFGRLAQERPDCQGWFVLGKPLGKALADTRFKIGPPPLSPRRLAFPKPCSKRGNADRAGDAGWDSIGISFHSILHVGSHCALARDRAKSHSLLSTPSFPVPHYQSVGPLLAPVLRPVPHSASFSPSLPEKQAASHTLGPTRSLQIHPAREGGPSVRLFTSR